MMSITLTKKWKIGVLCALVWPVCATAAPVPVGEITMLLGDVKLVGKDGVARTAVASGPIHIGDSIETAGGGHVHVRFVDGGVISVRPASRLLVEDYRQQAQDPAAGQKIGAIKFRLDEGVVRSITGRWGEAARERFRLNTPIAAIGIRGTDFVVQSTSESVRVAVHSGAIVAAPFGGNCSADAVGPCQGDGAQLLSAEMGRVMLEVQQQLPPRILPRNGVLTNMYSLQAPASRNGEAHESSIHPSSSADKDPISETLAQTALSSKLLETKPSGPALIWGRWDRVTRRAGDTLTVPRSEAAANDRERVAENDYYALYRLPSSGRLLDGAAGSVTLGLASAQAHLVTRNSVAPAQVQGGQLLLDFSARQFNTHLTLNSAATGAVQMQAAGAITAEGILNSSSMRTRVKGALANDLREAAYVFEHSTPQGMFAGVANWR